jgi:hypothetical protein
MIKIEKDDYNMEDYDINTCLEYIKINDKKNLEILGEEMENQILMDLVNSISVDKEDNIGQELNKFFIQILPENKESDLLKVNYALSKRIRENSGLNSKQFEKQHEEYMTQIMNSKINQCFVLTSEINEKLTIILSMIYKKISKIKKFNKFEDLLQYITDISLITSGILEKYKDKERNKLLASSYIYTENPSSIYFDDNDNSNNKNLISMANNLSNSSSRISRVVNYNEFNKSINLDYNINNLYVFKELKTKKPLFIPLEVLILREKYEKIKKLKLILKKNHTNNSNEVLLLDQKDILNNIFILLNLKWIFPHLFEIEVDLTNEIILKDEIISINDKYEVFLKKIKRNNKSTYYQSEYKKRVYDLNKKSIFNEQIKNNLVDEFELLSESFSMVSSVKDYKDEELKKQENFMKKYLSSLEMIIIYWYFISKLNLIKTCNFTIPINLEDKILLMLKERKIYLFDFNLLTNLSSENLIEVTMDFNSLDNKLFQQILHFLLKNDKMRNCRLSFFPPEEYFEPQFLLNLLLNSDNAKGKYYISEVRTNEEIENFLLRKLAEHFEFNMNKFFSFFINRKMIKEFYLIFDMPNVLYKIDSYEIIIMKLIMNMLIYIDRFNGNQNQGLDCFSIIAENLFFDNRKHPFLDDFFKNMNIYRKRNIPIKKFSLKLKMIELTNIYKIIPYHIIYLSIGSFDLNTFQCFVEYITSTEFNMHSELISLQITLGNSILTMEQCFDSLLKLLTEHPKSLEQISIYTNVCTDLHSIEKLLESTNYNKLEKIFLQFNKKSIDDINMKKKYGEKFEKLKDNRDNNFMDLFFIKKDEKIISKILNSMYKIGKKYNNSFMDSNIFLQLEKFASPKEKKQIIVQYK